jgi:hypothetical protein
MTAIRDDRRAGQRAVKRLGRRRVITWLAPPAPARFTGETMPIELIPIATGKLFATAIKRLTHAIETSPVGEEFSFTLPLISDVINLSRLMQMTPPVQYNESFREENGQRLKSVDVSISSPYEPLVVVWPLLTPIEKDGTWQPGVQGKLSASRREKLLYVLRLWQTVIDECVSSGQEPRFNRIRKGTIFEIEHPQPKVIDNSVPTGQPTALPVAPGETRATPTLMADPLYLPRGEWLLPTLPLTEMARRLGWIDIKDPTEKVKDHLKPFGLRNYPATKRQQWTVCLDPPMPPELRRKLKTPRSER